MTSRGRHEVSRAAEPIDDRVPEKRLHTSRTCLVTARAAEPRALATPITGNRLPGEGMLRRT
jgi:hypothetical protein